MLLNGHVRLRSNEVFKGRRWVVVHCAALRVRESTTGLVLRQVAQTLDTSLLSLLKRLQYVLIQPNRIVATRVV